MSVSERDPSGGESSSGDLYGGGDTDHGVSARDWTALGERSYSRGREPDSADEQGAAHGPGSVLRQQQPAVARRSTERADATPVASSRRAWSPPEPSPASVPRPVGAGIGHDALGAALQAHALREQRGGGGADLLVPRDVPRVGKALRLAPGGALVTVQRGRHRLARPASLCPRKGKLRPARGPSPRARPLRPAQPRGGGGARDEWRAAGGR